MQARPSNAALFSKPTPTPTPVPDPAHPGCPIHQPRRRATQRATAVAAGATAISPAGCVSITGFPPQKALRVTALLPTFSDRS